MNLSNNKLHSKYLNFNLVELFQENLLILKTYFNLYNIFQTFNQDIDDPKISKNSNTKISKKFKKENLQKFNDYYKETQKYLKEKNRENSTEFSTKIFLFFSLRIFCAILAYYNYFYLTLGFLLSQVIILPYSYSVSFLKFFEIFFSLFSQHFLVFLIIKNLTSYFCPKILEFYFHIDDRFITFFFLFDFILCSVFLFYTPRGKSKSYPINRILASIFFGFVNTKSYFLILFFLLRGIKIYPLIFLVDYLFNISMNVNSLINKLFNFKWDTLFYLQHRISHLPHVYPDAHKFHHYLHDSTAFDAHIYGTGAPEELFSLIFELLGSIYFNCLPPCFNFVALRQSWKNKIGHTRPEKKELSEELKNHVDHHLHHIKNFSWNISTEMVLETNTNNNFVRCEEYTIKKEIEGENVVLVYESL